MSEIVIAKDSKLISVLAAQARNERLDSNVVKEADTIIRKLAEDPTPENRHQIAQAVGFTVEELQKNSLNFLETVADIKNVGYGEKAMFKVKIGGIHAHYQAKGSTTARSYAGGKQVHVNTKEVSARPAINIVDMRTGRVNFADLIKEANDAMTNAKIKAVEAELRGAMDDYSTPFYATSTGGGIVKATIDAQLNYFRRFGTVAIIGDYAAVSQLAPISGMAMNSTTNQFSGNQIDEYAANGILGNYVGNKVIALVNAYDDYTTTPMLDVNTLYLMPAGLSADMKNLKLVNEGGINVIDDQNINDMVYEIRLDTWFGAKFVAGKFPTCGMHVIGS